MGIVIFVVCLILICRRDVRETKIHELKMEEMRASIAKIDESIAKLDEELRELRKDNPQHYG